MLPLPPSQSVRGAFAGKHLVVTGVTGFLGKVWLTLLLDRIPHVGKLTLVVRGGHDRFERIVDTNPCWRPLRDKLGADIGPWLAERIEVVEGDITKPRCGLDADAVASITRADAVVHFAGITEFNPDPAKAHAINVRGARHVAALAARTQSKRLVHVSTCYVAGDVGTATIEEALPTAAAEPELSELAEIAKGNRASARILDGIDAAKRNGFPNIYTWSKSLAERVLLARDDIALTIVRPSIVECATEYPFAGWNEGLNTSAPLSWLIASPFRSLPAHAHHRFDIVPVDAVAKGTLLVTAAALRDEAEPVYQLASSDINPLTFGRTIELNGLAVRKRVRTHGATPLERLLLQHLDPVAVPFADNPVPVGRIRGWVETVAKRIKEVEVLEPAHDALRDARRHLRRVEQMLELFKPFIHDNDYTFVTGHVRALSDALPDDEQDLAWDVPDLCWRTYWVDVEYPGLCKWSIPLIRNEDIPSDPPSGIRIRPRPLLSNLASSLPQERSLRDFPAAGLQQSAK